MSAMTGQDLKFFTMIDSSDWQFISGIVTLFYPDRLRGCRKRNKKSRSRFRGRQCANNANLYRLCVIAVNKGDNPGRGAVFLQAAY